MRRAWSSVFERWFLGSLEVMTSLWLNLKVYSSSPSSCSHHCSHVVSFVLLPLLISCTNIKSAGFLIPLLNLLSCDNLMVVEQITKLFKTMTLKGNNLLSPLPSSIPSSSTFHFYSVPPPSSPLRVSSQQLVTCILPLFYSWNHSAYGFSVSLWLLYTYAS